MPIGRGTETRMNRGAFRGDRTGTRCGHLLTTIRCTSVRIRSGAGISGVQGRVRQSTRRGEHRRNLAIDGAEGVAVGLRRL